MTASEDENRIVVDFHVHLFAAGHLPRRWFEAIAAHLAAGRPGDGGRRPSVDQLERRVLDPDAALLIADMDAAGVAAAVSHPLDYGLAIGEPSVPIEKIVEHNALLQQRLAGRYYSYTSIDPRRPNAPDFIRASARRYGLKGVNLYPPAGFDPASPESLAVCRVAVEEGLPVLFHTGGANYPMRPRYGSPLLLGDVQAEIADLEIIIGHAGFPYQWEEAVVVARRNPNVYLEISQWYKLAANNYEKFAAILTEIKSEIGVGRLLFGSDHLSGPSVSGAKSSLPGWLAAMRRLPQASADFSDADIDAILGKNALRLLKIEGKPHA
ncbi:MAG: amidohydrolase family protein [Roseiarcus sp.]|jgi:predicted TIM-barrel fold metal-dependent hydrolase